MNRKNLLTHLLFGASLVALVALGLWWTVFIARSVDLENNAHASALASTAQIAAIRIGHDELSAAPRREQGPFPMEVVPVGDRMDGDLSAVALPGHPEVAVRPVPSALSSLGAKLHRRRIMVLGEGSLLFLLIGVCSAMLFQLVRQESRHASEMEDFVASVTHEMKTPLAGIKSLLQTLRAGRVPEEMKDRLLALGLHESERLEHSIENALIAGSLRTERLGVHIEDVALRNMLDAFVAHREHTLPDHPGAVSLKWEAPPDLRVRADPDKLRVILENLVDNGLKYGGDTPCVCLRVSSDGDRVAIAVEDQGIGFPAGTEHTLFEAFHRDASARRHVQHGTGLGLSIASVLARSMDGSIEAQSDGPGKGAIFTLHLPESPPYPGLGNAVVESRA
jgi:signal transduction histidine kinase